MPAATLDFDRIFTEHADFAWRVLARHGVHERDLEDACQEVFVVVFKRLADFEGRSGMKTWIYGICRRVAANHRKRAAHHRETPSESPPEPLPAGDGIADGQAFSSLADKQALTLLDGLLARLPAEQREVFLLYEVEELSVREIAELLGCSQSGAFARLYGARRAIDAALKRLRAQRRVA